MADNTRFGQAAYDSQPVYFMDEKMAWEQRLGHAYDEASAHIRASMEPGSKLDLARYELAADVAGTQLTDRSDVWTTAFQTERDPAVADGVNLDWAEAKEYYLGHYAQASANLGAFVTGYAREQILLGALSQSEFDQACDMRLRALSDIIYLGRQGSLPSLLNGKSLAAADGSDNIIVSTQGAFSAGGASASGLGLGTVAIVAIVIVCAVVGAGIGVGFMMADANIKQRRLALDICQDAVRRGHKDAAQICGSMKDVAKGLIDKSDLASLLFPEELQKKIVTYGALGLGALLLVNFAPNIMRSLSKTQDVYSSEKIRRLRSLREMEGFD